MVLGIPDMGIWAAYLLSVFSTLLCVVYGLVNWNKGGDDEINQIQEKDKWEESGKRVEANLQ